MGICSMTQGAQTGVLSQPREVGWGGRDIQEGRDTCIPMADSYWCMAETNTTLKRNYPSTKNKLKLNLKKSPQ